MKEKLFFLFLISSLKGFVVAKNDQRPKKNNTTTEINENHEEEERQLRQQLHQRMNETVELLVQKIKENIMTHEEAQQIISNLGLNFTAENKRYMLLQLNAKYLLAHTNKELTEKERLKRKRRDDDHDDNENGNSSTKRRVVTV